MRKPSARVFTLASAAEGLSLSAYKNKFKGDVWTIGRGHTLNVKPGDRCTEAQADAWFRDDVAEAALAVNREFPDQDFLTQGKFDALVDFAFQFGATKFHGSTLVKLCHAKDFLGAANEFGRWVHDAAHNVIPGLPARRAQEVKWFLEVVTP
jgi:lysozyme